MRIGYRSTYFLSLRQAKRLKADVKANDKLFSLVRTDNKHGFACLDAAQARGCWGSCIFAIASAAGFVWALWPQISRLYSSRGIA
jgi:hypothetical protein